MSNVQVYFMRLGKRGPIKIGWTGNLVQRVRQIAEGLPDLIIVEASLPGGRPLELRLHRALHASRRRNEWFNPTREVEGVVTLARGRGLAAVLRWLDRKEAETEIRPLNFVSTDDFDADIRMLVSLAFKLAAQRHGKATVCATVGKSVDAVEAYISGRSIPPLTTFFNLVSLDAGAVAPFFARCGELPRWIEDETARDALDGLLGMLRA